MNGTGPALGDAACAEQPVVIVLPLPRRTLVPWWLRIAIKLVLARLPVPQRLWRRIGIFRHGCLAADVAVRGAGFRVHYANYTGRSDVPLGNMVEIGPGDSLGMALWGAAYGARASWLIDIGRFAIDDPAHYRAVCTEIARQGRQPPELPENADNGDVLRATNAAYRTDGIAALAALPDNSIDLVLSQAVLEHIPRPDMAAVMRETYRVLRPGGVGSHIVDLQDHLGGALNNLRLPAAVWEHPRFARSGFYTNRLRCREICGLAQAAGFSVSIAQYVRWPAVPTSRRLLGAAFRDLPEEELSIAGFTLVLHKPGAETGDKPCRAAPC